MYSSGPSNNFATMRHSPRDEIFVSGVQRNAPPIDNQDVASLHYDHVFVVVMSMRGGWRCLTTLPKRHLAPVSPVEDVALDSRCRLICCGDPVCWMLHELGEIVHGRLLSHSWRRLAWPLLARSTESRYTAESRQGFTDSRREQPIRTGNSEARPAAPPRAQARRTLQRYPCLCRENS